jgi:hypothetical protein
MVKIPKPKKLPAAGKAPGGKMGASKVPSGQRFGLSKAPKIQPMTMPDEKKFLHPTIKKPPKGFKF